MFVSSLLACSFIVILLNHNYFSWTCLQQTRFHSNQQTIVVSWTLFYFTWTRCHWILRTFWPYKKVNPRSSGPAWSKTRSITCYLHVEPRGLFRGCFIDNTGYLSWLLNWKKSSWTWPWPKYSYNIFLSSLSIYCVLMDAYKSYSLFHFNKLVDSSLDDISMDYHIKGMIIR